MIAFIRIGVVVSAVVGGCLMAGGQLMVLFQPSEFVVIGGVAAGPLLIGTNPKALKQMVGLLSAITKSGPSIQDHLALLDMFCELLRVACRDGVVALESPPSVSWKSVPLPTISSAFPIGRGICATGASALLYLIRSLILMMGQ